MRVRKAVCLVSGGLDSAVAATIAKCERYELYCLTVNYGQRNQREIEAAKAVAHGVRAKDHKIIEVPLREWGGSALTDDGVDVPKGRTADEIGTGIPPTYVPARNTILLALALGYAETVEADAVFIGAHTLDYSGYPDCRPEFMEAMQAVAKLATRRAVEVKAPRIFAPLLSWDKVRIIETGYDLRAPIKHTWSCYEDQDTACGECDACLIRLRGFEATGRRDPVKYGPAAPPTKEAAKPSGKKAAKKGPKVSGKKARTTRSSNNGGPKKATKKKVAKKAAASRKRK